MPVSAPDDPDDLYVSPAPGHSVSRYGTASSRVLPALPPKGPPPRPGTLAHFRGMPAARPRFESRPNVTIGGSRHPTTRAMVIDHEHVELIPGAEVRLHRREYDRVLAEGALIRRSREDFLARQQGQPRVEPAPVEPAPVEQASA